MKIRLLVACREERRAEEHRDAMARVAADRIATLAARLDDITLLSAQQQPDVVLLEHEAGDEEVLWSILHRIAQVSPASRILMLCDLCTDRLVTSFIANGASGSVATGSNASLWAKAVLAVHRGESWFPRSTVLQALRRQLAAHRCPQSASSHDERVLTTREREILSLIGAGLSNKEIGRALNISDQTVKTHLHHIYVKLNRSGRYKAFAATPPPVNSGGAPGRTRPPQS